jgi:hypothetical protein
VDGTRLRIRDSLGLILLLSLMAMQACSVAAKTNSSKSVASPSNTTSDLSGVWIGTSITSCFPLRLDGPWRCGARANIMLTLFRLGADRMGGFYASDTVQARRSVFEERGSVIEVSASGSTRVWMRVVMSDHSSCLFTSDLPHGDMEGSYLCFREGSSFERGRWAVRRSF